MDCFSAKYCYKTILSCEKLDICLEFNYNTISFDTVSHIINNFDDEELLYLVDSCKNECNYK